MFGLHSSTITSISRFAGPPAARRLSEEGRKNDIPIVALNPGGILNWKYKAEARLRQSGLRHCVVRATGLIPEGKGEIFFHHLVCVCVCVCLSFAHITLFCMPISMSILEKKGTSGYVAVVLWALSSSLGRVAFDSQDQHVPIFP